MALFHGVDEKLPLLTQFYQAEGAAEIAVLVKRHGREWGVNLPEVLEEFCPEDAPAELERLLIEQERDLENLAVSFSAELLAVQQVARRLMVGLADDLTVDVQDLAEFHEWLQPRCAVFVRDKAAPGRLVAVPTPAEIATGAAPGGSVRARLVTVRSINYHPYRDDVAMSLFVGFNTTEHEGAAFLRCGECDNVFETARSKRNLGKQKYCSHRCAARAGQRRRRKKSKESELLHL